MRSLTRLALLMPMLAWASPALVSDGAPDTEALAGYVLVWVDAKLLLAPRDDAKSVSFTTFGERAGRSGQAMPMRMVSAHGAFVEVETLDPRDNLHCSAFTLSTTVVTAARLFVKRSDLAPVVTRAETVQLARGGTLEIQPGMPVERLRDGRVLVRFSSSFIGVTLPAESLGFSYADAPAMSPQPPRRFRLRATSADVGGTQVKLSGDWKVGPGSPQSDGTMQVALADFCAVATVSVPADSLEELTADEDPRGFGLLGGGDALGDERWFLPKGTPVTVADGEAAATTLLEPQVRRPEATDTLACFTDTLRPFQARFLASPPAVKRVELEWCAPAARVSHRSPVSSGPSSGKGRASGRWPK